MSSDRRLDLLVLQSDLERDQSARQQQLNAAQFALDQLGGLLRQADGALNHLERQDVLGSAIVRGCQDLADAVGSVANHIDEQTESQRRALAQACIEDAQACLLLREGEERGGVVVATAAAQTTSARSRSDYLVSGDDDDAESIHELSTNLSEDQVVTAIQAAGALLRDVESTLRAVNREEAEEIADVALTVAQLFIHTLLSVHESIAPEDLPGMNRRQLQPSNRIEILQDSSTDGSSGTTVVSDDNSGAAATSDDRTPSKRRVDRVRVLWPPLGPAVGSALDWGKDAAAQKPLLAVALGLTLWPAALMTTLIGAPLVMADGVLQNLYNNFHDAPILQGLERSAAQLYQTGRLSLLCTKLVGRHSLRVVRRQVDRHGGPGKIAQNLGGMAVERVTHPVETIHMAWNGICWGVGVVQDAYHHVANTENERAAMRLQQ